MTQLLTSEETRSLSRETDLITGYGTAGPLRTIQWLRKSQMPDDPKYTNPTSNSNGVSGWCTLDGMFLKRVHVCAYHPCNALNLDKFGNVLVSKYGRTGPPDDHVRVYLPHLTHLSPTPSVSDPPPPPPHPPHIEVSPPPPPHIPIEVSPPPLPPPPIEVSSVLPAPVTPLGAVLQPSSGSSSSSSSESSTPRSADTDEPAVELLPGGIDIKSPERVQLEPIVGATPSSNCTLPPVQLPPILSAVAEVPALADDDIEDISVVAELNNPEVAAELARFLEHLLTPRRKVGIAAFLLFALVFRKRVRIWYVDTSEDIVELYAPWAVNYITEWATVKAVACRVGEGGRLRKCNEYRHGHDMTHWVGAWQCDETWTLNADEFKDDEDEEMLRHYHSRGLHIERTECRDDCGVDTMSLMLGEDRSLLNRTKIRRKLVRFVKRHRGNRALISMLSLVGELRCNLGNHDLESVAAELFTHRCRGVEPAEECSEIAVPESRHFTDEEIDAVKRKLNMHKSTDYQIVRFMTRLSTQAVSSLVVAHKSVVAEPPAPKSKKPKYILGRDRPFSERMAALQHFWDWTKERYSLREVESMRQLKRMPRGLFAEFVRDTTVLKHHCTVDKKFSTHGKRYTSLVRRYHRALEQYCTTYPLELDAIHPLSRSAQRSLTDGTTEVSSSVVAESGSMAITPWADHSLHLYRLGRQRDAHAAGHVCSYKRRRQWGAGRPRKCMPFRETYTRWFGGVRFSINVSVMCRVPLSFLLAMAKQMYHQYLAICLELGEDPETVDVGPRWVKAWLMEVRLSSRMPNRKYKVRRWVLTERLCIFWINIHKWRFWVWMKFGYDPDLRNVDQTPLHKNESGSKTYKTITVKGAYSVPLLENHAATRERMSVSTVTDSNEHRIKHERLPGFEVMFKANGQKKATNLQKYADSLEVPFKLSVVAGSSGSYKEEDLLAMQDKWLEPWVEGRRWEAWLGDAYAPGLTNNIQMQCWQKGYQSFTHGGGASMIGQTNDTELHKPLRKGFSDYQEELVLQKTLNSGGGLKQCTDEENIMLLATVLSDPAIHLQACKGYKYTGTSVAFNGSEDRMIGKDAKVFWDELDMRARIDKELIKLKVRYDNGDLIWNYENVQKEIIPYPPRGKFDEGEPEGMEDEAVESVVAEHENPWEEDGVDVGEDAAASDIDSDAEPEPFEAGDWVSPDEAKETYAPKEKDLRCRGDIAVDTNSALSLGNNQHTNLLDFTSKIKAYKDCFDNLRALQCSVAYSLSRTVDRVMSGEKKRLYQVSNSPAEVFAQMEEQLQGDMKKRRILQEEYQKAMSQAKEKHELQKKVSEGKSNYNKLSAEMKRIEAVVAAMTSEKVYSPEMLGQGKSKGGNKEHRQNRYDALERARRIGGITEDQKGQWDFFKTHWDDAQATEHGENWGQVFAESVNGVLLQMLHGEADAFSKFVKAETDRVLGAKRALVVPGIPTSRDI